MEKNSAQTKDDPLRLLDGVKRSGFPFQCFIADSIQRHGGYTVETEVAYDGGNGSIGFIDIVAVADNWTRLIFERKRSQEDVYQFLLRPDDRTTSDFHGLYVSTVKGVSRQRSVRYGNFQCGPTMLSAEFCCAHAVKTNEKMESRLLEGIVHPLVVSTEAYAAETHRSIARDLEASGSARGVVFIPILLTTAKLFVVRIDPRVDVDPGTGDFNPQTGNVGTEEVEAIRFQKELRAKHTRESRTRTVIVARPSALPGLLKELPRASANNHASAPVIAFNPHLS